MFDGAVGGCIGTNVPTAIAYIALITVKAPVE
jgi:hypothetical protein